MDSKGRSGTLDHMTLQALVRKDPLLYKEEFLLQYEHFCTLSKLFQLNPNAASTEFEQTVAFLTHTCHHYGNGTEFSDQLIELIETIGMLLSGTTRLAIVGGLMVLKKKNQVANVTRLYNLLIRLWASHDRTLREMIYRFLIRDIRSENEPSPNERLNSAIQTFLVKLWSGSMRETRLEDSDFTSRMALKLMIDLCHRGVWQDARTVNHIALACLSPNPKLMVQALCFFLGKRFKTSSLDDAEETGPSEQEYLSRVDRLVLSTKVKGNSRSMKSKLKKAKARLKKCQGKESEHAPFYPFVYLNDPQGFAEKLFQQLGLSREPHQIRLVQMDVISRLMGFHKVVLASFYSFMVKYLRPTQANCTNMLVFVSQASHDHVPVDSIREVARTVLRYFVAECCADRVIVVGLNAIREICSRCIKALDESDLEHVIGFKKYKNKGVVSAVRSILSLYRQTSPEMLPRRERGKAVTDKQDLEDFVELDKIEYVPKEKHSKSKVLIDKQQYRKKQRPTSRSNRSKRRTKNFVMARSQALRSKRRKH